MDDHRFDHMTRSLFASGTRRGVASAIATGTLGTLIAPILGTPAAAKCVKLGKACDKRDPKKDRCCGGAKCKRGRCRCGQGREACGKVCCTQGAVCVGGTCVGGRGTCPKGTDGCVDGEVLCNSNPDCVCAQRLQGGTRCVQFLLPLAACDQCATDDDCLDLGYPAGSSCLRDDGPRCACVANALGLCGEPCGFVPPMMMSGSSGPDRGRSPWRR